ncbi:T9SS type A sorting domain-containing protein [Spirosoma rigui]|uniref:T9SS type A sorting domain-containing protein n=1 Tax=Spirosoma rigui TaxID=564064 RepID=UPI0009B18801|nr:T9SS type A sorting domain-containing protein [Spirosoma rigui]
MARQGGVVVSYVWNLKVACGRARQGVDEAGGGLQVRVLGNPVSDWLNVMIQDGAGQSVEVRLIDLNGHLVENRSIGQAEGATYQQFDLRQQRAGLLLLRVRSGTQNQTVKIVKQ